MAEKNSSAVRFRLVAWAVLGGIAAAGAIASLPQGQPRAAVTQGEAGAAAEQVRPGSGAMGGDRASMPLAWRLNNPAAAVVPEARANPAAVADKFAARVRSIDGRAQLRAFEGAPPVVPHPISDLSLESCRECHASGLQAGDKTARMVSHTLLTNCTQCHVESGELARGKEFGQGSTFAGLRPAGYGGTRAWAGAPPLMPHTTFMRTNCISCHGEHGYDGWRPDHLSRSNCVQCHAPGAEFDQLSPSFGIPDVPDGAVTAERK